MTYTTQQATFCLNIISNLSAQYNGNNQATIQSKTAEAINKVLNNSGTAPLIGNWTCAWGPVVVAANNKAINTMYVAKSKDNGQTNYVVAIAGTDATSVLDWR